jgi:diguanylate cyclase (GGDEF)-like protein
MVAGPDRPEEIDPSGVRKMLRLLDSLRDSPAGTIIYRQVEGMLDDIATSHLKAEIAYAGFVNTLLDAFATHLAPGSPRYVQVKLLQARLQPPLTPTELQTLSEFVSQYAEQIRSSGETESFACTEAISPLLRAFGIDTAAPPPVPPATPPAAPSPESASEPAAVPPAGTVAETVPETPAGEAGTGERHGIHLLAEEEVEAEHELIEEFDAGDEEEDEEPEDEDLEGGLPPATEVGEDYRSELEARRKDIQKMQTTLGQQVVETITQNEEFGVILEVVLAELHQAEDVQGIENARWTLIREIEKLMKGHNELADKLDSTHHYLQLIESDSRQLADELTRVRLLSLTDELTGLPNRRAFMRRMEDEVARVQRYGFPLSFALIDLDRFKSINDEFGHAAGDEVLRVYSRNIMTVFRHHDMVARYGGEEFAVLLPNTDADGAIRALNKVRRRAAETRWQLNGTVSQVPSFSAGVSLFKPGESVSVFIERADKALYRAKRLGRDRIELDVTYETEDSGRSPRRRSTDL